MRTHPSVVAIVFLLAIGPGALTGIGATTALHFPAGDVHAPRAAVSPAATAPHPFAFVSNFEDHALDGWHAINGTASVVAVPNYHGEPSLSSTKGTTAFQTDIATRNFSLGNSALSFQADLDFGAGGVGIVGLFGPGNALVAFVGVSGTGAVGVVFAGSSLTSYANITTVPNGTAQPDGWVSLLANVYTSTAPNGSVVWLMDVFVDRTDVAAATGVSVPLAGTYRGAIIETLCYTMYYSNIVYTTNKIASAIPGYNNMDGYGQGSGLNVQLLPKYTTLSASMLLSNWSVPQADILSFQINAMNRIGATKNTCTGFYQLGVDLNPGGRIAPWFVPNNNCVAYYFNSNNTPRVGNGFVTPAGSHLTLKIIESSSTHTIVFQITDLAVTGANHTLTATIPYNGTPFYAAYTQMEWQPCCSKSPIGSYFFNGTLSRMTIVGGNVSAATPLNADYMIPYALDVPPSWCYEYYNVAVTGYDQVG